MRKNIDNIEIKEPPIEELKKKRSCLKRSCTTGLGCIIILVIAFLLLLKFVATPRPKELKTLPDTFPASIPVYDPDSIEYITFLSGKQKSKVLELAAYIPKIVLVPIFISAEEYAPEDIKLILKEREDEKFWSKFFFLMRQPITKQRDIFEIKWIKLGADPEFVKEYYETELYKQDYKIKTSTETETIKQITFTRDDVQAILYIKDDPDKNGTDVVILTVMLSEKNH